MPQEDIGHVAGLLPVNRSRHGRIGNAFDRVLKTMASPPPNGNLLDAAAYHQRLAAALQKLGAALTAAKPFWDSIDQWESLSGAGIHARALLQKARAPRAHDIAVFLAGNESFLPPNGLAYWETVRREIAKFGARLLSDTKPAPPAATARGTIERLPGDVQAVAFVGTSSATRTARDEEGKANRRIRQGRRGLRNTAGVADAGSLRRLRNAHRGRSTIVQGGPTEGAAVMTIQHWSDLAIGIAGRGRFLAIAPAPDDGTVFAVKNAIELWITASWWDLLLSLLAQSEDGRTANKSDIMAGFGFRRAETIERYNAGDTRTMGEARRALRSLGRILSLVSRRLRRQIKVPTRFAALSMDPDGTVRAQFVTRHLLLDDEGNVRFGNGG